MAEQTTATVKSGTAYYEGENFSLSNIDKVKTIDFSKQNIDKYDLSFSRSDNNLIVTYSSKNVTIKDFFNAKGAVVSSVKTIRVYDSSEKNKYKDYNLATSGILNAIDSGVTTFDIKKGVMTGTAFADTMSAASFNTPTGKNKDTGVTIKTGSGNDNVTGSSYNDTFNINGSGTKTINIKATDGDDVIKGIHTKDASLVLNLSGTVLDSTTTAAANATYERVGNDLKITAPETIPAKINNLDGYIWYKENLGYDSTLKKYIYKYGVTTSTDPVYNYYEYSPHSFSAKPLYSYQDGETTKYTEYRDITNSLADAYLLVGYDSYDGAHYTKIFTSAEAANTFMNSYYDAGDGDTCTIKQLSTLSVDETKGKKILYSYKIDSTQIYSETAPDDINSVTEYHEYDVENSYYKYNEQNYTSNPPTEVTGNCTLTDTAASEYTTVSSIYSYVNNGSMAYSFDAATANYVENAEAPTSSTTTIKDYFKNSTAPSVKVGLKNVQLIDALNKSDIVNIDRQYKLNKDGSVAKDKNNSPIVQTGKQTINGTFLNDVITGGAGKDTINLGLGNDKIDAGKGDDTINIKNSGKKVIAIANEDGSDTITGTSTSGASTYLNFTDIDVDSTADAKSNLVYERTKNNLIIKRTYTVGGENKTSTTTIKDYFKNTSSTPSIYFGDGSSNSVSLSNVLSGFNAGTTGTHLNDTLQGTNKADKITTGNGTDTITAGLGNDKITIDGSGNKYVIMNNDDGVDTLNIKNTDATTYIQFKGADIISSDTAKTNLTYEKSGKNDLKITYVVKPNAKIAPTGFYISNTGVDINLSTTDNKYLSPSYYYTYSTSYYTQITGNTGLYSYETDGETRYTTVKNSTVALGTAKVVKYGTDAVGYLTGATNETSLAYNGATTLYAYKSMNNYGDNEYVYSTSIESATTYSNLWLKPSGEDRYIFATENTDGCISVASQDNIYYNPSDSYVTLVRQSDKQLEISKNSYGSIYYIDSNHQYVTDIDNNSSTPIYKAYTISDSYYLQLPTAQYSTAKGIAVTNPLTADSYTKVETIYKMTDADGNVTYSLREPENFEEKIESSTSVIIKDYLTKTQKVRITYSNSVDSSTSLSSILSDIGLNIGDANSKKAQTLTGTNVNDNIVGGSGKDKITTGKSNSYGSGDVINPGAGNDTITIDGDGYKTVNIANKDGNDTIIFTDNDKSTKYDYTSSKRLYLNYDDDANLTYERKGKDLVINRSYLDDEKTANATTTLKDYFNVDYKYQLGSNIRINDTTFNPLTHFNNTTINKSVDQSGKAITKAQKINGDMFDNTITGGSGNDTINGYGGSDTMNGGMGSDTYVVNSNTSGSKHYYADKIIISDTGNGEKDVDTLKLDVKKKDVALLFNVSKITSNSPNDIIVGDSHYSYDNQLMVFADFSNQKDGIYENGGKLTSNRGIIADGIEKITTSDKKTITLDDIREIAQNIASWLSTTDYSSTAEAFGNVSITDIIAQYNPGYTATTNNNNNYQEPC